MRINSGFGRGLFILVAASALTLAAVNKIPHKPSRFQDYFQGKLENGIYYAIGTENIGDTKETRNVISFSDGISILDESRIGNFCDYCARNSDFLVILPAKYNRGKEGKQGINLFVSDSDFKSLRERVKEVYKQKNEFHAGNLF